MSESEFNGVVELSRIEPFKSQNLLDHMLKNPTEWLKFIENENQNSNASLPGSYSKFLTKEEENA